MGTTKHTIIKLEYTLLFMLLMPFQVLAIPFSSDIGISGSVVYDSTNSTATGTTQSGSITSVIGESISSNTINGATITGSNTLSGTLTDLGDGFGSSFIMSGDQNGDKGRLISDSFFNIVNNSATDQYQVSFAIDFLNLADADGTDSFADSQLTVQNDLTLAELFFTDLFSDSLFGDKENGTNLGSFGASLSDSGTVMLDFLINPLASVDFSTFSDLRGEIFDATSSFSGEITSFISISDVTNLTNPEPVGVPAPATLLLMLTGLIGMVTFRRKLS